MEEIKNNEIQKNDMLTVVCISDTHTHTENLVLPEADILIHSGDFTYTGKKEEVEGFNNFLKK
jgi:3',5'-cyclic AMP phosphodiesterase CpdA